MDTQRPAIAIGKHAEVAASLGSLDDAKRVFLAGDGNVGGVVAGELEKDAGVRAALVGLTCGMEKARAETKAGGGFFGVANLVTNGLE